MANVEIYNATEEDVPKIVEIGRESLPIYFSKMEAEMMLGAKDNILLVAKDKDQVIGFLVSQFRGNRSHIMSIAVTPKYRSQNAGTLLLKELERKVDNVSNMMTLNVHTENVRGVKFYQRNGFTVKQELPNYYGKLPGFNSQNAYFMCKPIGKYNR